MQHLPRLLLAGLSGGSGKTLVSLGLCRAWARNGLSVAPFKKGPDYIDAAWLSLAAGRPATNLDTFLMEPDVVRALFAERMRTAEVGVVEGNRGLFDGLDEHGSLSSAELARLLLAPVVLVLDATKMTRTTAAIIKGINNFEEGTRLAAVILNRTAGERHRTVLRRSIETHTQVPIAGFLPKISDTPIPERHMGLWSAREMDAAAVLDPVADLLQEWCDLDMLRRTAEGAPSLAESSTPLWPESHGGEPVRIGVVRDDALWFYYPENLEALERAGAELVFLSILDDEPWPDIHGLYMGGGFPETLAERIRDCQTPATTCTGCAKPGCLSTRNAAASSTFAAPWNTAASHTPCPACSPWRPRSPSGPRAWAMCTPRRCATIPTTPWGPVCAATNSITPSAPARRTSIRMHSACGCTRARASPVPGRRPVPASRVP